MPGVFLQWVFPRLNKNKDGLVDYSEAATGRWSLQGPRVCQIAFLQECDKDQSKSVSKTEWLNCFQITPGDNASLKSVTINQDSRLCSLDLLVCVGNNIAKLCNKFSLFCLECNKSCSRGQLDTVLCQCKCPDDVIQGRVLTSSGVPLRDVGILLELFPYTEVSRTNESGYFSITDRCENKSYTVKKNDYIPLRLESGIRGSNPLLIRLEDAGMLMVCDPGNKRFHEHVFQLFQVLKMYLGSLIRSNNTCKD